MLKYPKIVVFSILFSLFFLLNHSQAKSPESSSVFLNNINYSQETDFTRITIEISNPAVYHEKYLSNPDRIYLDIENTNLSGNIRPILIDNGVLKQVRTAQHDKDTARVVLELTRHADYNVTALTSPDRLAIDIYNGKPVKKAVKKETTKTQKSSHNFVKHIIVIDPGHGGKDPGAKGKSGLQEKDIVLDVGRRVKKLIEEKLGSDVVMTRDDDVFIPLGERTAIANKKDADLFVSIHVNSAPREGARGVETYLLGRATDKDAMDLAARENSTADKSSLDDLQFILTDLVTTVKKDESFRLAHYIQENLIDTLEPRYNTMNLGVKQAPFYVLVHTKMPSILAEISFVSNPEEERLMYEGKYRQEIAESIFDGIKEYLDATPLLAFPKEARK
ncbi:MAG: N-acetylmuramoyl-L-alanine amidase [Nitrospirae bacterium]|nr:N-acetylmuramoyl-L-alanine amidase [Nitrospirota bacterium]